MLAGGRSIRFGGNKLAAMHRGVPLLHHPVLRLGEVCAEVVVVIAPEVVSPSLPDGPAVRVVRDEREGEGPLAGLLKGLEAVETELAIVAAGDMPDLAIAVLLEMLRAAQGSAVDAVVLQEDARFRPLPNLVRVLPARRAAGELLGAGERSLRALLLGLRAGVLDEAAWTALDPGRGTLRDVDVPGDLS